MALRVFFRLQCPKHVARKALDKNDNLTNHINDMETCEDSGIMDLELDKTFGERKDQDGNIIDQGLTSYK